jgi:hypothetical protein
MQHFRFFIEQQDKLLRTIYRSIHSIDSLHLNPLFDVINHHIAAITLYKYLNRSAIYDSGVSQFLMIKWWIIIATNNPFLEAVSTKLQQFISFLNDQLNRLYT